MKELNNQIHWTIYRNLHNTICFATDGVIDSELQKNLEDRLYGALASKCRWQLSVAVGLLLQPSEG
jgi:hypothetical protein